MMKTAVLFFTVVAGGANCLAAAIALPGGSVNLPSNSSSGVSFSYTGTLTGNDTLALTESGSSCLQTGPSYCVNGAGVVTVAGTSGVGQSSSFTDPVNGAAGTWVYGSILLQISGVGTEQIFPTNAADGLGSAAPPTTLSFGTTTLNSLGFGNFSVVDPTITFVMADDAAFNFYDDNTGQFTLTPTPVASNTPEPATAACVAGGVALLLLIRRKSDSGAARVRAIAPR